MTTAVAWARSAELPPFGIWWYDDRGDLVDFSTGVTAWQLKIGNLGQAALLTKTTGITGAAGSGSPDNGVPNVVVAWAPGDLDIAPGTYTVQIAATFGSTGQRVMQTTIVIEDIVA